MRRGESNALVNSQLPADRTKQQLRASACTCAAQSAGWSARCVAKGGLALREVVVCSERSFWSYSLCCSPERAAASTSAYWNLSSPHEKKEE